MAKAHVCDHDMMKKILGTKDHLKGHDKMTMRQWKKTYLIFLPSFSISVLGTVSKNEYHTPNKEHNVNFITLREQIQS